MISERVGLFLASVAAISMLMWIYFYESSVPHDLAIGPRGLDSTAIQLVFRSAGVGAAVLASLVIVRIMYHLSIHGRDWTHERYMIGRRDSLLSERRALGDGSDK